MGLDLALTAAFSSDIKYYWLLHFTVVLCLRLKKRQFRTKKEQLPVVVPSVPSVNWLETRQIISFVDYAHILILYFFI